MDRRKTKALEEQARTLEMYAALRKTPQGTRTDEVILKQLIRNMKAGKEVPTTLLGIIELLRINAPRCILSREEKQAFFSLLVDTIPREKMNLERFIAYRIPSLLTNRTLIARLVGLAGCVSGASKEYLKEIIVILIEEREEDVVKEILRILLLHIPKDPGFSSVIEATREVSMPIVALVMEEFEDKAYADVYVALTLNKDLCIRNIRGPGRLRYIQAAMCEKNFEKLCGFYIGDKDKRIVELLATNCTPAHRSIFQRILTDHDENARAILLKGIEFEDVVRFDLDICERVLDSDPSVRRIALKIFRDGAEMYKKYFEEFRDEKENGMNRMSEDDPLEDMMRYFLKMIQFVFRGVLTRQREEYVQALVECALPWEFYFQIRSYKGVDEFLRSCSMCIELDELPDSEEKRRFYLRYLFRGKIQREDVVVLIEEDVHSALEYLKDKDCVEYVDALVEKALSSGAEDALMIVELVRPHLAEKVPTAAPVSNAELLIYAHSKYASIYIDDVSRRSSSFPALYFLAHMKVSVDNLAARLSEFNGTCEEHVEILLAYNDKRLLGEFVDYFMDAALNDWCRARLVRSRTFVGSMIYFMNTGQVSIRNIAFFVSSIHFLCMHGTREAKIRHIYEVYATKVDQDTFNSFYTVCLRLRHMSTSRGPHQISSGKVVLEAGDKLLISICNTVLAVRKGNPTGEAVRLSMFHEVPARIQDMVSLGHVL